MKLGELYNNIGAFIEKYPGLANCEKVGVVDYVDDDGFKNMRWLNDFRSINVDGHGGIGFELVLED